METASWIIGILIGVTIGLGLALRITVMLIMESNDIGDSTGTPEDFGDGVTVIRKADRMSKRKVKELYRHQERR